MARTKDIRAKLTKRLGASEGTVERLAGIIEEYDLYITVRNFDDNGLLLYDGRKQSVRVVDGRIQNGYVHLPPNKADITIVYVEDLRLGWVHKDDLEDLVDRFTVPVKAMQPMPSEFLFKQGCEHMSVFGGWTDGDDWTCLGCGKQLVFNE